MSIISQICPQAMPRLGFGLGLRPVHYETIFEEKPKVDFFEIISENFMDTEGKPKSNLACIKDRYPIIMHGVSLSIGSSDPLNQEYLQKLKKLADWVKPAWISDHLCWTGNAHHNMHDLLPMPYTQESLDHIVKRIKIVQDYLERPIALENPSTYLSFQQSSLPEADFIREMVQQSGCYLLLDVNNIYVSCFNGRLDIQSYLDKLPLERVIQIHLAGHSHHKTHIIDTHDDFVCDDVWQIYAYIVQKLGFIPNSMIEWDSDIPEFSVLYGELAKAQQIAMKSLTKELTALPNFNAYSFFSSSQEKKSPPNAIVLSLQAIQDITQKSILKLVVDNLEWIVPQQNFSPHQQLAIYQHAYDARLYEVVHEDYPVLGRFLGDDVFGIMIKGFVRECFSDHFNIARFSWKLPEYIKNMMPDDIIAQEIAQLEAMILILQDACETTPLEAKHLEGVDVAAFMSLKIPLRTALNCVYFAYDIHRYYDDVMTNERVTNKPKRRKIYLAVFRHDGILWRMPLEKEEYHLLSKMSSGHSIVQALEHVKIHKESKISYWFSRWINNGLLAKF